MKLTTGTKYDIDDAQLTGWTTGDGTGHEGYHWQDYFGADGAYLGPDVHGIEPLLDGTIDLSDNPEVTPEMFAKAIVRKPA